LSALIDMNGYFYFKFKKKAKFFAF
jgi:hypothetical protein